MKITSRLQDNRIGAVNVLAEMSLSEYADLISDNLSKNEFQRRRVSSSKTVYALLKDDMRRGCVIPPLVLALTEESVEIDRLSNAELEALIVDQASRLVILDGLQRTHTIIDLLQEIDKIDPQSSATPVGDMPVRVEVYVGLNRLGILYRMLTLNTGQTPMSLRQQIEMLYLDYHDPESRIDLIREADNRIVKNPHEYNFKDVVEGFNAYLNRDELPIDRTSLLENIRSLEKLSKENQDSDVFRKYSEILDDFIFQVVDLGGDAELAEDDLIGSSPFGRTVNQVFKKPQAMSGLGAALGKLIDRNVFNNLDEASEAIENIKMDNPEEFLVEINRSLSWLKNHTTKIGNAQRTFFTFYFRELLNPETDSYLDLQSAATTALRKYQDQNI
ncbi:hypothetical protein [Arthrobacter sp. HY1533]|uniref:hypothetical protein n=1 Tax=Arthrobacter sp. HY1533 TaxID=2970919 RepID=UPI0022B9E9F9|nr:hypothetical protein [Arthrobacter sp. HY1533]